MRTVINFENLDLNSIVDLSNVSQIALCFENCEHAVFESKDFFVFGLTAIDGTILHFGFKLRQDAVGLNECCGGVLPIDRLRQFHDITQITLKNSDGTETHYYVAWPYENDYEHPAQGHYIEGGYLVYTCVCNWEYDVE